MELVRRMVARVRGPAATYLVAAVLARVGSYVLIPLYTRKFTVEEYGTFALAQTLVMLLQTLVSAAFMSGVSRVYFDGASPAVGLVRAGSVARAMAYATVAVAVLLAALVLVLPSLPLFSRWEALCIVAGGAGGTLASLPYMIMRLTARPVAASLFNFGQFTATAVTGIVLVAGMGRGLQGGIEAIALSGVLNGAVAGLFVFARFRTPLDGAVVREGLRFALPLAPTSLLGFVSSIADRWILKFAGLDAEVGSYSLASQLMTPATMVQNAWNEAESVRIGEVFRAKGLQGVHSIRAEVLKGYVGASVVPAIGLIVATPLLGFFIGKAFSSALVLMPLVAISLVVEAAFFPDMYVLYYGGKAGAITLASLVKAVVNVSLALVLLPITGVFGVIWARIVSSAVSVLVVHVAVRRHAQLKPKVVQGEAT